MGKKQDKIEQLEADRNHLITQYSRLQLENAWMNIYLTQLEGEIPEARLTEIRKGMKNESI
jgi:hypothetical protein